MPRFFEQVRVALPRLTTENHLETSPGSWQYNCVAWAAGVTDAWWWPTPGRYWPADVPHEESLAAFVAAFATLGYEPVATLALEPGVEKVAVYALDQRPTHASRQLPSGRWTSKLGPAIDIEHATADAVGGGSTASAAGRASPSAPGTP
jgi:hypothetical protein